MLTLCVSKWRQGCILEPLTLCLSGGGEKRQGGVFVRVLRTLILAVGFALPPPARSEGPAFYRCPVPIASGWPESLLLLPDRLEKKQYLKTGLIFFLTPLDWPVFASLSMYGFKINGN